MGRVWQKVICLATRCKNVQVYLLTDGGLVMTVKTHGHSVGKISKFKNLANFNGMTEVNHSAILIIRNPFDTFIGNSS